MAFGRYESEPTESVDPSAPALTKTEIDASQFTWPRIYFTEREVLTVTTGTLVQDLYKVDRPMLVDYLCLAFESFTVNGWPLAAAIQPGTHGEINNALVYPFNARWWVTDRAFSVQRTLVPVTDYYNHAEGRRWDYSSMYVFIPTSGVFAWHHPRPWLYKAGSGTTIEVAYVTGDANPNAPFTPPVNVVFYGTGVRTGHQRIFECQVPVRVDPGNVAPNYTLAFTETEFLANRTDEDYEIHKTELISPSLGNPAANVMAWTDTRQFNMFRVRIMPDNGDPFSESPVPLVMYGVDDAPVKEIWYRPSGGPLFLEPGQAIGWDVQNTSAFDYNVQAGVIGRVVPAPGGWR